ncbi:MAG: helix-turn-helix domain-containing protein [Proteobacteria bacterium]|nr:helix-turn-helix domain-containing protein [Pseudomonadota bacterium]
MTPEEIRTARETLGLMQAQLAAVMGLRGAAAVSEWEKGKRTPDGRSIRLLRAYLDGYRPSDWPLQPQPPTAPTSPS